VVTLPGAAGTLLRAEDIASGTITARADDIDLSGGSEGDVLTVQADGSLALEAPGAGTGDVTKVGTPANNQMAVWTGDGTLEGSTILLSDGASLTIDNGVLFIKEQAEADADAAGYGQVWVDTATPNVLYFTDDAGTDFRVSGALTSTIAGLTEPSSRWAPASLSAMRPWGLMASLRIWTPSARRRVTASSLSRPVRARSPTRVARQPGPRSASRSGRTSRPSMPTLPPWLPRLRAPRRLAPLLCG
jgi:hypothetical protein